MTAQLSREDVEAFIKQVESDMAQGWESQAFELKLAKHVLAGLGSEPVAKVETDGVCWYADNGVPRKPAVGAALYAAPPAPVAVPDEMTPKQASRAYSGEVRGYLDGWNACRADMLKAGPVTGWIKCSERMPGNDDAVLILTGYMQTAYWCADENEWCWGDDSWFPDLVTHWMPLPAAPEQEV